MNKLFISNPGGGGGASGTAAITGGTVTGLTSLGLRNAGTGAFDLTLACNTTLAQARTLTLVTGDADRSLTIPASGTVALLGTANVFTANQIISVNGAASTPPLAMTGTWFTGGSTTTTKPALLVEPSGTTSTLWATTGTGIGVNAPSGFAGNMLDALFNGQSIFRVNYQAQCWLQDSGVASGGSGYYNNFSSTTIDLGYNTYGRKGRISQADTVQSESMAVQFGARGVVTWQSTNRQDTGSVDLLLMRDAAAVLQLGLDHASSPTAQTLKAHDVTTGTGASLTLAGGTGSVAGGAVILATSVTTGAASAVITAGADGSVIWNRLPSSAPSLGTNGNVTIEFTNNTTLTFKARGSDGTTRSGTITLS